MIAARLADRVAIAKARVLPYQLMTAYAAAGETVPRMVRDALQDAMEIATENVPQIEGKVYVCPDVSGSMASPATGHRKGSTTAARCIDVAAMVTAAIVRKNPTAEVLPFETRVVDVDLNARDSVMTNAEKLAAVGGGGTTCSAPLALLNRRKAKGELVIFVSDNESWADPQNGRGTAMMQEWNAFRQRNANARLVCIDIHPYATTQVSERDDVLNVGGFSDAVFTLVADFAAGKLAPGHWTEVIESIALTESAVALRETKEPNAGRDYIFHMSRLDNVVLVGSADAEGRRSETDRRPWRKIPGALMTCGECQGDYIELLVAGSNPARSQRGR